jgi:opacity protein-like surface antigen
LSKQVVAIGFSALVLAASPVSANETSAIAGTVAGGVAQALVCTAAAFYANEDEVDPEAYDRPGLFIGAGANYAIDEFSGDVTSQMTVAQYDPDAPGLAGEMTKDLEFENSFGLKGQLGYRCHSRFSIEAQVEWVDGFDADVDKVSSGKVGETHLEPLVVTTNAKAYLLTGRTQPFLRVGLGFMRMKYEEKDLTVVISPAADTQHDRKTRFAMRFGGGIDHYLTKNIAVSVDVDYVNSFSLDVDYVLVGGGIQYRF